LANLRVKDHYIGERGQWSDKFIPLINFDSFETHARNSHWIHAVAACCNRACPKNELLSTSMRHIVVYSTPRTWKK